MATTHRQILGWAYPVSFRLEDEFSINVAAGGLNATNAAPGPGVRTVADTNSVLSITDGILSVATGGAATGDPGLWYGSITRTDGIILFTSRIGTVYTSGYFGYDDAQSGSSIIEAARTTLNTVVLSGSINTGIMGRTEYSELMNFAVVLRSTGAFYFMKGGAYTTWSLVYIVAGDATATLYPVSIWGTTEVSDWYYVRSPVPVWKPVPLVSDGFGSSFGTSDGLGHAETTGLGSGGSGLTWTSRLGTWQTSGGVANASALDASGIAIATITLDTPDIWCNCTISHSSGICGIIFRYIDADNYYYCAHDGTNLIFYRVLTGTPYPGTSIGSLAKALAAGARIIVDTQGVRIRTHYNETAGTTTGVAANTTGEIIGLITSDTGNTFDDFAVWNKGTSDEHKILDRFSP